jgi:hypothetical protein
MAVKTKDNKNVNVEKKELSLSTTEIKEVE